MTIEFYEQKYLEKVYSKSNLAQSTKQETGEIPKNMKDPLGGPFVLYVCDFLSTNYVLNKWRCSSFILVTRNKRSNISNLITLDVISKSSFIYRQ